MSVRRSRNLWIDHNTFVTPTDPLPEHFGRKYEIYDGQLDITHNADRVTVSHNVFRDHDETMLIGSTDNADSGDPGLLNVTLRHNVFDGVGQRAPRMRFGRIDVYNNLYRAAVASPTYEFGYLWGVGFDSRGHFEGNYLDRRGSAVDLSQVVADWGGAAVTERGTWARTGPGTGRPVSALSAYNAVNDPPLDGDAGWTPELRRSRPLPAPAVPAVLALTAGAGKLPL